MLAIVGYGSLEELAAQAIPASIADEPRRQSAIPPAATEVEVTEELRALAAQNIVLTPMIGLGYYGTHTPAVIRRNVLENPAWYTAYTPYQPEISQGRLEASAQLPDGDQRPDRAPGRRRVVARRADRGRRGDGAVPAQLVVVQPSFLRRRRRTAANDRGDPNARTTHGLGGRRRRSQPAGCRTTSASAC